MTSPDDAALHLSWQPVRADYTEAFRARNRARKAWLKMAALIGAVLVIGIVLTVTGVDRSLGTACIVIAPFGVLMALVIQPVSVWSFWRRNTVLHEPLQASIDPATGITLTGQSSGTHPWSIVHSFLETDRVFVVQLSGYRNLGFFLLAKRGLPDTSHVDRLRSMLSAR